MHGVEGKEEGGNSSGFNVGLSFASKLFINLAEVCNALATKNISCVTFRRYYNSIGFFFNSRYLIGTLNVARICEPGLRGKLKVF